MAPQARGRGGGRSVAAAEYIPVGVLRKDAGTFPEAELAGLERHGWIRCEWPDHAGSPSFVRVHVLPDDVARNAMPRDSPSLRRALKVVMSAVDKSPEAWEGDFSHSSAPGSQCAGDEESLWYIFNTLDNPDAQVDEVRDWYGREAICRVLASTSGTPIDEAQGVDGLRTALYPFQARTAATMIQREVQPKQMLDPRLQVSHTPTGQEYYYDKEEGNIVREKRLYSEACGGILAETMGCGKTLICLAVILATRGHVPKIPIEYMESCPTRPTTGSLMDMAASTAGRFSVPWESHFRTLSQAGFSFNRCIQACERNRGHYVIPPPPSRYQSREGWKTRPPPTHLVLNSGTIVVVPQNLVDQWLSQIEMHTSGLRVLVLRSKDDKTPSAEQLLHYDVILFSQPRFEKEAGDAEASLAPTVATGESPLKKFHWLRIIVDEGHNFAGHGHKTNAIHMLDQLHVERRWIVSGTPSTGLYGLEMSLASLETVSDDEKLPGDVASSVLQSRKRTESLAEELKDLDKLRLVVVEYLKLQPWSNSRNHDPANWAKYIKPVGPDGKRRKSPSLRAVLQGLVVRHRLEVIDREIPLPRLHNSVVHLEPTFYDKLTINMFLLFLTVNAVTSERQDQDYMFHSRNRKYLSQVINNLRQAGFWWTGFQKEHIESTVELASTYLEKNRDRIPPEDIELLVDGLKIGRLALNCKSYMAFCRFHELGVYLQDFPEAARALWSLTPDENTEKPLLLGISEARFAQKFVTSHLTADDPAEGLAGEGIVARRKILDRTGNNKSSTSGHVAVTADNLTPRNKPEEHKSSRKSFSKGLTKRLPAESPLSRTKLLGTASAKLTYLLDRVQELHKEEKIIIFYENNNTAFWIAEGLELLGIDFRIYAGSLKATLKTEYLQLFEEGDSVRVLLLDLRQAAHGLHIARASRVFIVNPIWRPNVESQAIKRAHRIGQTRPVFVETLVLKGTLEEKMLRRRQEMTSSELRHAEKDMLDDPTMNAIIQRERFIPLPDDGDDAEPAYLREAVGFFDRHELPIPDDHADMPAASPPTPMTPKTPTKRKAVRFSSESPTKKFSPWTPPTPASVTKSGNEAPVKSLFGG
ncbi:hypothetical protein VTN31DRAFT_5950 [Thermomyces dupontii]|uniref:uncharacterized protein n=1 Tax=Talaromyces thermophilus TaxID=28565 RepID=UPI003742604F